MEAVLDLYAQPYDPAAPVVCFDEKPVVLHADVLPPVLPAPGRVARQDYEYERLGMANLLVFVEPLAGTRCLELTDHRTMQDFAHALRWLVDEQYPEARVIRLVLDNLNTHTLAALYATFPPAEARRIAQRVELHFTPKHGSWLNMAEIEISVLARGCLQRRVAGREMVWQHLCVLAAERNAQRRTIHWRFSTHDARFLLRDLYPTLTIKSD